MDLTTSGREWQHPVLVAQEKPAMGGEQRVGHGPWLAEICR